MIAAGVLMAGSAVLMGAAVHPFLFYPAGLALLGRLRRRPIAGGTAPKTAALCVCAYNEAAVIRAKARNMLALRHAFPALEILVYVDASSDRTAEILLEYTPALRVVVSPRRMGKTHGMNTLVGMTQAECLVFSDANVMFAGDAVPKLLAPFADPAVGLVCGHLHYGAGDGAMTASTGSLYWRMEERIRRLESATGSVIGADGSIFAMRRTSHRPPPIDLIDDFYLALMVLCDGGRVVRAADALAYEDQVSKPQEEFRRKIRIACQAFNVHRALWPRLRHLSLLDRTKYISHKLLRWLVIYLLAGSIVLGAVGLALAGLWFVLAGLLAMGSVAAWAVMAATRGPLLAVRSILSAFAARRSLTPAPMPIRPAEGVPARTSPSSQNGVTKRIWPLVPGVEISPIRC
jgi:cellulose synthase/poly-beta-1,6-N-acetylglucosamine synthase-like glycosyltransferase